MNPLSWLERRRYRAVWSDPHRSLLTLESFAETEEDGGRDLQAAALRVRDEEALTHILHHAKDEVRHARLFRDRARVVAEAQGRHLGALDEEKGKAYDLSGMRSQDQVNAHGFFQAGLFDEMGEVGYVAMVHVAERRAAHIFTQHRAAALAAGDEATAVIFEEILRDEKYHVAWTGTVLKRWRGEGRDAEVSRALSSARRGRALDAWRRLGLRSASGFATVLLCVLYWTVLAPFGLIARRTRSRVGWQDPSDVTLTSQY
jgi:rubrerythrin